LAPTRRGRSKRRCAERSEFDSQLISDGTYLVAEAEGSIVDAAGGAGATRCSAATRARIATRQS